MIHANTEIGAVSLTVSDLARSLDFYQQHIGLQLHSRQDETAVLGVADSALLYLRQLQNGRYVPHTTGLYHFALLLPTRQALADTLYHFIAAQTHVGGYSDHAVSEALYLSDPDGHGIELYADRPRSAWEYRNGTLQIVTKPLDLRDLLDARSQEKPAWQGLPSGTRLGHIHLHVADLDESERFYNEVLGFDRISRYGPAAAFLSAGGYHHHIGMNTWAGVGIPAPPADAYAMQWYSIVLPSAAALDDVNGRLSQAGVPTENREQGILVRDPAQNNIILTTGR